MPTDSPWLALPLILPIAAIGVLLCLIRAGENLRHAINILTCAAMTLGAAVLFSEVSEHGVLVLRAGNWPAPFGITLVADLLSATMVLVTAVVGLVVAVYSVGSGTAKFRGYFAPLFPRPVTWGERFVSHGRYIQSLRLVRGHADGVVRARRASRRPSAA